MTVRRYTQADLKPTAGVWLRSGQKEYDYLDAFQSLDEQQATDVFHRVIAVSCTIWVYEIEAKIVGFMAMKENLIDRLYVEPEQQGNGIGSVFIDFAKKRFPSGLVLNTHEQNSRARAFYEKRGFVAVRFGMSPPPESMPDIEYCWNE